MSKIPTEPFEDNNKMLCGGIPDLNARNKDKKPLEEEFDFIKDVEDFIEKYNALDIVIDPRAEKITSHIGKVKTNLAYHISYAISLYQQGKSGSLRLLDARDCLYVINTARGHNVVKPGEGVFHKVKEYGEKITKLEEENKSLKSRLELSEKTNLELMRENDDLKTFKSNLEKDGFTP